jgi:hypothetical protein
MTRHIQENNNMRQAPFMRSDDTLSSGQAVLAGVDYLRKQVKLSDEDSDRATIIEGLGAIAVVLAAATSRWQPPAAMSLSASEGHANRQHASYDIVDAIVTVADAQLQPLLATGPKFSVPKRSSGGGAMSMSMRDPEQEAIDAASPKVVASLSLVEFALANGSFFPADKPSGKFFAYLLAHKPAAAQDVESVINSAFKASEK